MPFSKYDVDPAHIEAMRTAFKGVCEVLQLNCGTDDPVTDLVVMKIVATAKAGELDPDRLCNLVLAEVGTPSQGPGTTSDGLPSA